MRHRDDGGLLGNPAGDPQGAIPVGTPCAISHRGEGRVQRLEIAQRLPQLALPGVIAGRKKLH
jgi:hypothetical protein